MKEAPRSRLCRREPDGRPDGRSRRPGRSTGGEKIAFNFASSSTLARQIREGAPADLFLSADEAQMDGLEKAGLVVPGDPAQRPLEHARRRRAGGQPAEDRLGEGSRRQRASGRLALAEPTSVPVGVYSKKFFESVGIWDALAPKIVPTENVRATLAAVESGNVDAGIVYRTDAAISKQSPHRLRGPAAYGPAISYPFALVKGAPREKERQQVPRVPRSPAARASSCDTASS